MKSVFTICCVALLVIALGSPAAYAQATGDFRSNGTGGGNWSSAATWQTYNGSTWGAASAAPTGGENITLQGTDTVTVDAAVVISGTLTSTGGAIKNPGSNLVFSAAGVYVHAMNGGGIPVATWNIGSTCKVTGVQATGPNFPSDNPLYNLVYNCPGQTGNAQISMTGTSLTINGNFHVGSTATFQCRLSGSSSTYPSKYRTWYIAGNLTVDSANSLLTTAASSTPATGDSMYVGKNLIVSAGTLNLANGSQSSSWWFLSGDFIVGPTASIKRNSTSILPDNVYFVNAAPHTFTNDGTIQSGSQTPILFEVDSGSTLNTGMSQVNGGANFVLKQGATLETARPGGIDSAVALNNGSGTAVSATFEPGTSFIFDGSAAQVTGATMPKTVANLTVNNAAGLALTDSCTVTGSLACDAGAITTGAMPLMVMGDVTSTTGYVNGPLTVAFPATGTKLFAVGTANGSSPVSVDVLNGSGNMTVTAVQGSHPNTFNAAKTLQRYWTLKADAGITLADLSFGYLASDVQGDESKYGAWRYTGAGTAWDSLRSVGDVTHHTVTTDSVATLTGDWTMGESSLSGTTGIGNGGLNGIPQFFFVSQNYPNPFNPSTVITYGLPKDAVVAVKVYSMLGQEIATLYEGRQEAGTHTLRFNGAGLASGVYFFRVQAGASVAVKQMILLK